MLWKFYFSSLRFYGGITEPIADHYAFSALYFLLGRCYYFKGDIDKARSYMERSVAISPENYESYYHLGHYLEHLKKYQLAAIAYKRGLEFFPSPNGDRMAMLGNAQFRAGQLNEAMKSHLQALALETHRTYPYYQLGVIHKKLGNFAKAKEYFIAHQKLVSGSDNTIKHLQSL